MRISECRLRNIICSEIRIPHSELDWWA